MRARRRRGSGDTESSKQNGLEGSKLLEDFPGSSSGYSSEDEYLGRLFCHRGEVMGARGRAGGAVTSSRLMNRLISSQW